MVKVGYIKTIKYTGDYVEIKLGGVLNEESVILAEGKNKVYNFQKEEDLFLDKMKHDELLIEITDDNGVAKYITFMLVRVSKEYIFDDILPDYEISISCINDDKEVSLVENDEHTVFYDEVGNEVTDAYFKKYDEIIVVRHILSHLSSIDKGYAYMIIKL